MASVNRYWEVVKHKDSDAVAKAFESAWREFSDWMPSLGQIVELIESFEASAIAKKSHQLTEGYQFDGDGASKAREIVARLSGSMDMSSSR